jgi:gamma-glutamyl-gamma-aminobutyrate hydrolase PuuD
LNRRVLVPFRHATKLKPYEDALRAVDLEPVPAGISDRLRLGDAAGLVLIGGTDVNPRHYGQARHPETNAPDDDRDDVEMALIHEALKRDLPLLAICRGLQILNVCHRGTLLQHIPSGAHRPAVDNPSQSVHEVNIEPHTMLSDIAGLPSWRVNSRHHQAVDKVGDKLHVSARSSGDGIIEALERADKRFVLAVQWHPEDQFIADPEQLKLFQRFAAAL